MTEDAREQVSARVPPGVLSRLDVVASALAERVRETMPGSKAPTRADAVRASIERGLDALEHDLGISALASRPAKKGTTPARRRARK